MSEQKQHTEQSEEQSNEAATNENELVNKTEVVDENIKNVDEEISVAEKLADTNDKYIRLVAEFDNFRKRTARERLDLLMTAGENVISGLLPILDDLTRAVNAMQAAGVDDSSKQGVQLINDKLYNYLQTKGLQRMDIVGLELDTDLHEAVAKAPAQDKKDKNKIADVVETGYMLNGKVIRFAKVIVGE